LGRAAPIRARAQRSAQLYIVRSQCHGNHTTHPGSAGTAGDPGASLCRSPLPAPQKAQKMAQAAGPDPRRGGDPLSAPAPSALWQSGSLLRAVPARRRPAAGPDRLGGRLRHHDPHRVLSGWGAGLRRDPGGPLPGRRPGGKGTAALPHRSGQRRHRPGTGPAGRSAGSADL